MRRTAALTAVTVIGLYLVLSFKSAPVSRGATAVIANAPTTSIAPTPDAGQAPAGPPPPGTGGTTGTRTVTGPVVTTRYGDVQVAVTLSGSRITDIKAPQLPFDRARSRSISDQVAPILQQEVLAAQSAQIDTVSGATYTSEAYAQSLQAALDQARG